MTDKGFGIYISDDYVPHPKTEDERNELVKKFVGINAPTMLLVSISTLHL